MTWAFLPIFVAVVSGAIPRSPCWSEDSGDTDPELMSLSGGDSPSSPFFRYSPLGCMTYPQNMPYVPEISSGARNAPLGNRIKPVLSLTVPGKAVDERILPHEFEDTHLFETMSAFFDRRLKSEYFSAEAREALGSVVIANPHLLQHVIPLDSPARVRAFVCSYGQLRECGHMLPSSFLSMQQWRAERLEEFEELIGPLKLRSLLKQKARIVLEGYRMSEPGFSYPDLSTLSDFDLSYIVQGLGISLLTSEQRNPFVKEANRDLLDFLLGTEAGEEIIQRHKTLPASRIFERLIPPKFW